MLARESKGPIQNIVRGLLGFFQLKDQGNPGVLSDTLQGCLELRDWYFISNAEVLITPPTAAINVGTIGFQSFSTGRIVVPDNEVWWVHNYTVSGSLPAVGEDLTIAPAMLWPPAGAPNMLLLAPEQAEVGTAVGRVVAAAARGFWAPSGAELGFYVANANTATQLDIFGGALFTRCTT